MTAINPDLSDTPDATPDVQALALCYIIARQRAAIVHNTTLLSEDKNTAPDDNDASDNDQRSTSSNTENIALSSYK